MTAKIITPSISLATDTHGTIDTKICFTFQDMEYSFILSTPAALFYGAERAERSYRYASPISREQALHEYFKSIILDKEQTMFYNVLLSVFKQIKERQKLDDDEYAELLTSYVQSIPYDDEGAKNRTNHYQFPVETACRGTGICSDKSLLLAGLLAYSGFSVAYMEFDEENHAMTGICVSDGDGYHGGKYAVIETTAVSMIGDARDMHSSAHIYPVDIGKKKYRSMSDVKMILSAKNTLKSMNIIPSSKLYLQSLIIDKPMERKRILQLLQNPGCL